jgi:hypothetical protein
MDNAEVFVESTPERPITLGIGHGSDVPLAARHSLVSACAQHFGDGHTVAIEVAA